MERFPLGLFFQRALNLFSIIFAFTGYLIMTYPSRAHVMQPCTIVWELNHDTHWRSSLMIVWISVHIGLNGISYCFTGLGGTMRVVEGSYGTVSAVGYIPAPDPGPVSPFYLGLSMPVNILNLYLISCSICSTSSKFACSTWEFPVLKRCTLLKEY